MPVGWETHSSPEMGNRAQEVINKQVLKDSDLLIAVFWTRLGTPTGVSPSGTVEEIREHIATGKPAMIYFSSQPVRMDSVDQDQYRALQEFKNECKAQGLIEEYETIDEFRDKLARQLAQTVIRHFAKGADTTANESELKAPPLPQLSDPARQLLQEAIKDKDGVILRLKTHGGASVQTNERDFVTENTPREVARWDAAVDELERLRFLEDREHKRQVYFMTNEGYRAADLLVQTTPPETDRQRKVRKILAMKGKLITLRWLNASEQVNLLGRVKGEAEMIVRDCDEDTVFLENAGSNTSQSLPLDQILIGFDDKRQRAALEVKP